MCPLKSQVRYLFPLPCVLVVERHHHKPPHVPDNEILHHDLLFLFHPFILSAPSPVVLYSCYFLLFSLLHLKHSLPIAWVTSKGPSCGVRRAPMLRLLFWESDGRKLTVLVDPKARETRQWEYSCSLQAKPSNYTQMDRIPSPLLPFLLWVEPDLSLSLPQYIMFSLSSSISLPFQFSVLGFWCLPLLDWNLRSKISSPKYKGVTAMNLSDASDRNSNSNWFKQKRESMSSYNWRVQRIGMVFYPRLKKCRWNVISLLVLSLGPCVCSILGPCMGSEQLQWFQFLYPLR